MQHLLERLLELAVLEQRQTLRDAKELSLDELVLAARSTLSNALSKKGLTVVFEAQTKALVWGESVLLVQAVRNLIDNASDFAMPDTVIRIIATRAENAVVLRIHNVGPAIPDYAKGRIFERFYSLPRPDSGRRSQGLGLAFVREVTDLHGGTVEIANAADGVDAIVTLPLRAKFDENS
jgi:two-component system sensor histidine kinase CreC